jgi:uncharacterized membrane protein
MTLNNFIVSLLFIGVGDQSDFLFWSFIFFVLLIVLALFIIIMRAYSKRRLERKEDLVINLDDLSSMKKTGLITDEEMEKARKAVRKYYLQKIEEEKREASQKRDPLTPLTPREIAEQALMEKDTGGGEPDSGLLPLAEAESDKYTSLESSKEKPSEYPLPQAMPDKTKQKSKKEKPVIDVEDLYAKGIISEDEYRDLRKFFENKQQ